MRELKPETIRELISVTGGLLCGKELEESPHKGEEGYYHLTYTGSERILKNISKICQLSGWQYTSSEEVAQAEATFKEAEILHLVEDHQITLQMQAEDLIDKCRERVERLKAEISYKAGQDNGYLIGLKEGIEKGDMVGRKAGIKEMVEWLEKYREFTTHEGSPEIGVVVLYVPLNEWQAKLKEA